MSTRGEPMAWYERGALAFLPILVLAFGGLVELRSAFQWDRKTDAGVYFRAAWAVRTGRDPYGVTDDRKWHYVYPVPFAIAMTSLADPPAGYPRPWTPPFAASVAVWYLFSVGCLLAATFALAGAVERALDRAGLWADRASRSRWRLRLTPVWFALPAIGSTLSRGQVNLLLLALLAGMLAAALDGKRWRAGVWLSAAICIKIIPAFLLVYPLWKRDWRWLGGTVLGCCVWLGVLPALTVGPAETYRCHAELVRTLIAPAMGHGDDTSRARELIETTATDNNAFVAVLHNLQHPDRASRPADASPLTKKLHWAVGGVLTLATLLATVRRPARTLDPLMTGSALLILMVLISPVAHLHYFVMTVPAITALIADAWTRRAGAAFPLGVWAVLIASLVIDILPRLPGLDRLRDGASCGAALILWAAVVVRSAAGDSAVIPARSLERLPAAA